MMKSSGEGLPRGCPDGDVAGGVGGVGEGEEGGAHPHRALRQGEGAVAGEGGRGGLGRVWV